MWGRTGAIPYARSEYREVIEAGKPASFLCAGGACLSWNGWQQEEKTEMGRRECLWSVNAM